MLRDAVRYWPNGALLVAAAIAPAIIVARAGGRGVRAVTPSRSRPTPAEDDREAAREDWTEKEGRPWSESDSAKSRKSA